MSSPERLNVLLSRARNALIMIGNAKTFQKARKGADQWRKLFTLLEHHIYNGFPVKCQRHEDEVATLEKPEDFDTFCPDGGCNATCDALLSCGVHKCISKCHMIQDHSRMPCPENISSGRKCVAPAVDGQTGQTGQRTMMVAAVTGVLLYFLLRRN